LEQAIVKTIVLPESFPARSLLTVPLRRLQVRLWTGEHRLTAYGGLLLALIVPLALALVLDERVLRGQNVWIKPLKFTLSVALLALTTAWIAGHLAPQRRAGRTMDWIVWLLIGAGSFELAYIILQAGLGAGSHYNVSDAFHGVMYALMGVGATLLTVTQPMLAWLLYRHPDPGQPALHPLYRQAMLLGLVLTFVLGAAAGSLLSARMPPVAAPLMPIFGWSLAGGDLRPAHFIGIHAEQFLPLFAYAMLAFKMPQPRRVFWIFTAGYMGLFAMLLNWGLAGGAV
jgi:hypothetical protein